MMKKAAFFLLLAIMGCSRAQSAPKQPPDAMQYLARQGWTPYESIREIASPAASVKPVVYLAKDARAPSCGLLIGAEPAPVFIDIWGPEAGGEWPQCLGFNDAASFSLNKRDYLVFEYLNQDTRDDSYRRYFYLVKDASGRFVEATHLNGAKVPPKSHRLGGRRAPPGAQEGITLARLTNVGDSLIGMQLSARDVVLDGSRFFALYQDKAQTACTFVVDNGTAPVVTRHETLPGGEGDKCVSILASGKLDKGGTSYYIAMYRGDTRNHVAIFSVNPDNAVAVETTLSAKLAKRGNLADMKSVKKALTAALG